MEGGKEGRKRRGKAGMIKRKKGKNRKEGWKKRGTIEMRGKNNKTKDAKR